ncbi:hypothetical protein [Streptosporangium pseudovulgare]|uniref:Uncharacterized protein n=1 Tax=Streptosporangium pseudovulgare TaxID=35765 RepID=A0ABQ2QWV3_9ACTN|nr:hypothetical protein [Streptosporangium pseudovulgare]GGP98261.1 hypothetical protein GCM10010140_30580 [Streptosporangium pseudovulgare]
MTEPSPGRPVVPMEVDHDQLENVVAPGFRVAGGDLYEAVARAVGALAALGPLPADEETDRRFLQWFTPKRDQMLELTRDLAGAYGDIGEGLLMTGRNVWNVDWGLAEDLARVPDYTADGPPLGPPPGTASPGPIPGPAPGPAPVPPAAPPSGRAPMSVPGPIPDRDGR